MSGEVGEVGEDEEVNFGNFELGREGAVKAAVDAKVDEVIVEISEVEAVLDDDEEVGGGNVRVLYSM